MLTEKNKVEVVQHCKNNYIKLYLVDKENGFAKLKIVI